MILVTHITIALTSIAVATLSYIKPSRAKLRYSLALTVATLASGTYLVLSTHSNMISACETGLVYLGAVSLAMVGAYRKLATRNFID